MNKAGTHLKRFAPFYLVWAAVSTFVIIWVFAILTKPTEDEKVDFFVCTNVIDRPGFEKFINENKPSYLKEVNANFIEDNNFIFSQNLATYGDQIADIYIMNKDKFDIVTGKDYYFYQLEENKSRELFGKNIEFYITETNQLYAIKINCTFIESVNLFLGFAKNSNHLKGLKEGGFSGAIELAQKFINS